MDGLVIAAVFVFGAVVGSFLNVCIVRLPEGRSVVRPPSHCPRCRAGIAWYDNVPVLSYLVLRGRCRACGVRISPLYPAVEVLTGALAVALWVRLGPTVAFAGYFVFAAALVTITFIDLDHRIIPDVISLPGIARRPRGLVRVPARDPARRLHRRARRRRRAARDRARLRGDPRARGHGRRRHQAAGDDRRVSRLAEPVRHAHGRRRSSARSSASRSCSIDAPTRSSRSPSGRSSPAARSCISSSAIASSPSTSAAEPRLIRTREPAVPDQRTRYS